MTVIKRYKCNAQVSIIFACKNMHHHIIDKMCIERIIKHITDCFHKEHIIESSVCGMLS